MPSRATATARALASADPLAKARPYLPLLHRVRRMLGGNFVGVGSVPSDRGVMCGCAGGGSLDTAATAASGPLRAARASCATGANLVDVGLGVGFGYLLEPQPPHVRWRRRLLPRRRGHRLRLGQRARHVRRVCGAGIDDGDAFAYAAFIGIGHLPGAGQLGAGLHLRTPGQRRQGATVGLVGTHRDRARRCPGRPDQVTVNPRSHAKLQGSIPLRDFLEGRSGPVSEWWTIWPVWAH